MIYLSEIEGFENVEEDFPLIQIDECIYLFKENEKEISTNLIKTLEEEGYIVSFIEKITDEELYKRISKIRNNNDPDEAEYYISVDGLFYDIIADMGGDEAYYITEERQEQLRKESWSFAEYLYLTDPELSDMTYLIWDDYCLKI